MSLKAWTLPLCSAVNLYLLGVMFLFAAVLYPQFAAVDRAGVPSLWGSVTARLVPSVVIWEFLALLTTVPLYLARPAAVPLWSVHLLLALGIAYFAITFAWHLPSHAVLTAGDNSPAALEPVLRSQWARTFVQLARAAVWLGAEVAQRSS